MKKLCALFLLFFTLPLFASGIGVNDTSAPCDDTTLETYGGTANMEVDWTPNKIELHWYDGNTKLNVQDTAKTCNYDGTITLPTTQPTRTGYTFIGWELRPLTTCGFENFDTGINGSDSYAYLGHNGENDYDTPTATYGLSENGTFAMRFSYGVVYGAARCSSTGPATEGDIGTPIDDNGQYCWCQITGLATSNYSNGPGCIITPVSTRWVYDMKRSSFATCSQWCSAGCALRIMYRTTVRVPIYSIIGQR